MAINETSVDGKKYRQKTATGWKWYSFITKAKDILFGDGEDANNNLETNLGSVKGITTSTNVTETGYAADATVVSDLNRSLAPDFANREKIIDGTNTTVTLTEDCYIRTYMNKSTKNQQVSINTYVVNALVGEGISLTFSPIRCKAGDVVKTNNFESSSTVYKIGLR